MKFIEGSSSHDQSNQKYVKINEDFLKVKHLLPTNKVLQTILHDNASQARQLSTWWTILDKRSKKQREFAERTKRNFLVTQAKKQGKWKKEDSIRINCLNLPSIKLAQKERPQSMIVLYNSSNQTGLNAAKNDQIFVPLRPEMGVRRSKAEIVVHDGHMSLARLPSITSISDKAMRRYNSYRGAGYLHHNAPTSDQRFKKCEQLLSQLRVYTPERKTKAPESKSKSSNRKLRPLNMAYTTFTFT